MTRVLTALAAWVALAPAAAGADKAFRPVDLQPHANQKLTDDLGRGSEGNNLAALPKGEQTLGGVKFVVGDGFVQRGSKLLKAERPDKIEGIKVCRTAAKLHFLHGTQYGNGSVIGQEGKDGDPLYVADGTRIAEYTVRYADGATATVPVMYGEDVRDWWFTGKPKGVTRGKVAWEGANEASKTYESKLRLYRTTWANPHPDKVIASIDYAKVGDGPAAPLCVAVTAEGK